MGTVIITGANSSLGIPAVSYLLSSYPSSTVICTVRDQSAEDINTAKLREVISGYSNASIRKLDLASLATVQSFTDGIRSEIAAGELPPLQAVIWNAMSWSLIGGLKFSSDGYERSVAVNHVAHFALTLRLLEAFDKKKGRIVFLGSDSHEKSDLQELPTVLPEDTDLIVHPTPDKEGEAVARGFQRYGLSKLVTIMTMYELNRRLKESSVLKELSALAVDPGGLVDSRALSGPDVPVNWSRQVSVVNFLQPVLKYLKPIIRRTTEAAKDLIDLAIGPQYEGQEGYFVMSQKGESSRVSQDEQMQRILWQKSLEWAGISQDDTILPL